MRVWFLKETKSICTSCATGCNTLIGTREDVIYRQTPRENDAVNSCWMCDFGRLNFEYLESDQRLLQPEIKSGDKRLAGDWNKVISGLAEKLRAFSSSEIAILASGRMTNEELWLTAQLGQILGVYLIDIVPRTGPADDILLSADRNPNSNGARLLGVSPSVGERLSHLVNDVLAGRVKALIALGESPLDIGLTLEQVKQLPLFAVMNILPDASTPFANVVLPSLAFAEKRGSMINGKGRLQRLNRAVRGPGQARDDWEILRDLVRACSDPNSAAGSQIAAIHSIEDVFRQMAATTSQLSGLSLSKIGDLGIQIMDEPKGTDVAG